ncbi:hypothetical protein CCYA_CCYA20G4773 [Cyanidiococcus yangmingshanensis]|nr:hypothetical protein CCYA_CCYA20G4773 [Cyanidiococcus yangmingshanensis]
MGSKRSKRSHQRELGRKAVSFSGANGDGETVPGAGLLAPRSSDARSSLGHWWMSVWKTLWKDIRMDRSHESLWRELQLLLKIAHEERLWECISVDAGMQAADWLSLLEHLFRSSKPVPRAVYAALSSWFFYRANTASVGDRDPWSALCQMLVHQASTNNDALTPLLAYVAAGMAAEDESWLRKELDERTWALLIADETEMRGRELAMTGQLLLAKGCLQLTLERALESVHQLEKEAATWVFGASTEREGHTMLTKGPLQTTETLIGKHRALCTLIVRLLRDSTVASTGPLRLPVQLFTFQSITWNQIDFYGEALDSSPIPPMLWLHVLPSWHRDILQVWDACIKRFGIATLPVVTKWLDQAVRSGPCNTMLHRLLWRACRTVGIAAASSVERCLRAHLDEAMSDGGFDQGADIAWLELMTSAYQSPAAWSLMESGITGLVTEKLARLFVFGECAVEKRTRIAQVIAAVSYAARDAHALEWLARHIEHDESIRNVLGPLLEALAHPRGFALECFTPSDAARSGRKSDLEYRPSLNRPSHEVSATMMNCSNCEPMTTKTPGHLVADPDDRPMATGDAAHVSDPCRQDVDANAGAVGEPRALHHHSPVEALASVEYTPYQSDRIPASVSTGPKPPLWTPTLQPNSAPLTNPDTACVSAEWPEQRRVSVDDASEASVEALLDQVLEVTPSPEPIEHPSGSEFDPQTRTMDGNE